MRRTAPGVAALALLPALCCTNASATTNDYGDAAQSRGYPTTVAMDGARHFIVPGIHLGTLIDGENDGQPHSMAEGDDQSGLDDEDGVLLWTGDTYEPLGLSWLQANTDYTLGVVASTGGYLNAWLDYNEDGDWADPGEQIFTDEPLVPGTNDLILRVPPLEQGSTTNSISRFRFGSETGLTYTGWASDGEVEDYAVQIDSPADFGDAAESLGYPVLRASDGARHQYPSTHYLGTRIDAESDALVSIYADGDDNDGVKYDDDGVLIWLHDSWVQPWHEEDLQANTTYKLAVIASTNGYLNAWMDFNEDGDWADPGEQVFTDTSLTNGTNILSLHIPPGDGPETTNTMRFRFGSQTNLSYTGWAIDGEVEDYTVRVNRWMDYGDADESLGLPVTRAMDGARHLVIPGFHLGTKIDWEPDGYASIGADGDDLRGVRDDDDGVRVWWGGGYDCLGAAELVANGSYELRVIASTSGYLNAWMDFNQDGDWEDDGERIFTDTILSQGTNLLTLYVPPVNDFRATNVTARFRFGSQTGLTYTGWAIDGEVEDHSVDVLPAVKVSSASIVSNGNISLQWTDIGQGYTVETTTNLLPPAWIPAEGAWPIYQNSWTGPFPTNSPSLFYRVVPTLP